MRPNNAAVSPWRGMVGAEHRSPINLTTSPLSEASGGPGRSTPHRRGMSMLEIMMAIGLLAIVITGVLGQVATLREGRRLADENERANQVLLALKERLRAVPWLELGTIEAPMTLPRLVGAGTFMTDDPTVGDATIDPVVYSRGRRLLVRMTDEETLALLDGPSGLEDLRVYVEYYRALTDAAGNPGIMDAGYGDWSSIHQHLDDHAWVDAAGDPLPPNQIDDELIVYRLLVTWGQSRQLELFGARRQ